MIAAGLGFRAQVCFLINLSFVVLWLANRFLLNDAQAASLMRKARSFDAVWSPPGVPWAA